MYNSRPTFFIKKNSTLPKLKFAISEDIMLRYDISDDMLENCAITFSMQESESGTYIIANKAADLLINNNYAENPDDDTYNLVYKFSLSDTAKPGSYIGEFKVDFLGDHCGKITFPTTDKIRIEIQDSNTKTTLLKPSEKPIISGFMIYFGKIASNGAISGQNRPIANVTMLTGGTTIPMYVDQTVTIPFNSTNDDYVWFAIPSILPNRSSWYVNDSNQGIIGGIVDDGGNLFPDPVISGGYKIYLSNYQSIINIIQILI